MLGRRAPGARCLLRARDCRSLGSQGAGRVRCPITTRSCAATRDNLIRSQREQFNYAYKERRTEFHVNPFGRVGTGGIEGFEVTPIENGTVILRRLIERDGKPVTDGEVDRSQGEGRARGRRADGRPWKMSWPCSLHDRIGARRSNGRDAIVMQVRPRSRRRGRRRGEGRIAKAFTGTIWVDEAAREVIRIEATAIDNISFGLRCASPRLNEGTTVTLHREPDRRLRSWLPTSIRFAGEGRALLLRAS